MDSAAAPGFLVRLIALPFWPKLWRESPERGAGAIVLPLALWALAAAVPGAFGVASSVRENLYGFASYFELNADPLVLDHGRFRLTGDRILRIDGSSGGVTVLVDPENTVPDAEIESPQYIAVRADRIVLQQPEQRHEYTAADVAKLCGDDFLFDGAWLRRSADGWIRSLLLVGYPVVAAFVRITACASYAFAVGLLLLLLRGQWIGLGYADCVTVALATSAFTIAADLALTLLGVRVPLLGVVLWPLVMTALGFLVLASRPAPETELAP
jgi:hypothetical protein